MPGPRPSPICPKCGVNPRRRPGLPCTPCSVALNKSLRRSRSARESATPQFKRPLGGRRFLVTSAQNATPAHVPFLRTLEAAARDLGAELVVVPLRYRNPTSIWSADQERDDWWDPALKPYLYNQRRKLGPNLVLVGDVKIQPTAADPLSRFESLTGAESCLIAHPKMAFRSVAAPTARFPKILSTTGSVTERNFTESKAGALGAFHHYLGAVIVELSGRHFHLRQINADRRTGAFIDLGVAYTTAGAQRAPRALGLFLGDTHARFTSEEVDGATFGAGGIVESLDPETLVWSDVLDGYSVNPHHADNPFIAHAKYKAALGSVRAEVEHAVRYVVERTRGRSSVIAPSNHDDFLARWVVSTDWRRSPANAAFYLETAQAMLRSVRVTGGGAEYADPFAYWVDKLKGSAPIRYLERDESFQIAGIECGMHGDRGPNGARGSLLNLSRIGAKAIVGHSHSPGIRDGTYQVGTSTPRKLEYTRGPSSWLNTHCVIYANGARSLITVIDGEWKA